MPVPARRERDHHRSTQISEATSPLSTRLAGPSLAFATSPNRTHRALESVHQLYTVTTGSAALVPSLAKIQESFDIS